MLVENNLTLLSLPGSPARQVWDLQASTVGLEALVTKVFWRAEINLQACTNLVSPPFQAFYLVKE